MKSKLNLATLLGLCIVSPALTAQQPHPPLTLSEALTLGLARPEWQAVQAGRTALAEADLLKEQTRDNPWVSLSSEHTRPLGVSTEESYLQVSQRIELFGVRNMRHQAARHLLEARHHENEHGRLDMVAHIKDRFYEGLYFQKRLEILEDWEAKTQGIRDIVALREKAGQASGFDRRRLSRESSEARALVARDRASFSGSWERLRSLLNIEGAREISGSLLPGPLDEDLSLAQHPKLLALDARIEAARLQARAAATWRLPEIALEAGIKRTNIAGDVDHGLFLAARIPLPIFNRKKSERLAAHARAEIARGEKSLTQTGTEGSKRALRREIQLLQTSVAAQHEETIASSLELTAIAEAAYREGEIGIMAVLDTYRALRDAQLNAVSMAAEARKLHTDLERLEGGR